MSARFATSPGRSARRATTVAAVEKDLVEQTLRVLLREADRTIEMLLKTPRPPGAEAAARARLASIRRAVP